MYTLNKTFKVETAHILDSSYAGECQRFHGHSAKIVVSIGSNQLNTDGMVVDFKQLKELFKPIYDMLDHHCLISEAKARELFGDNTTELVMRGMILVPFNPTAENLAKYIYDTFSKILDDKKKECFCDKGLYGSAYLRYIEYWETENACVRYDVNY